MPLDLADELAPFHIDAKKAEQARLHELELTRAKRQATDDAEGSRAAKKAIPADAFKIKKANERKWEPGKKAPLVLNNVILRTDSLWNLPFTWFANDRIRYLVENFNRLPLISSAKGVFPDIPKGEVNLLD